MYRVQAARRERLYAEWFSARELEGAKLTESRQCRQRPISVRI